MVKTPLAWKNLVHNKVRTAVAIAGVGFAVILMFMQLGFLGAVKKTATQIYDALEFDLMLRSPAYFHLTDPRTFPRERIYQAASFPGVEEVKPFYLGLTEWQVPQPDDTHPDNYKGEWRSIICMGTDPTNPVFKDDDENQQLMEIHKKVRMLTDSRYLLIDRKTKDNFGPRNGKQFGDDDREVKTVLGKERFEIKETFELGTGLASNGACITNLEGFARACYWQPLYKVNFGLVSLAEGEKDSIAQERLQKQLQEHLGDIRKNSLPTAIPADVEVLTRDEVQQREETRWVDEMPLGRIFELGVWVAVFVGVAIVYQVLSTDIANMMGEYATLKAMGYSNSYLTYVILQQSVLLAFIGYVPSILISWALYHLVTLYSGMPMAMTLNIALTVLGLAIVMCVVSGLAALRKLFQADPADLF